MDKIARLDYLLTVLTKFDNNVFFLKQFWFAIFVTAFDKEFFLGSIIKVVA